MKRLLVALVGLVVASPGFDGPENVNCSNLAACVATIESTSVGGMVARVRSNPLSIGFVDNAIREFFGVAYTELSGRDKRRFESAIKDCSAIARYSRRLSIPFRRDTWSRDYYVWQEAIAEVNSPAVAETLNRQREAAERLEQHRQLAANPWIVNQTGAPVYPGKDTFRT